METTQVIRAALAELLHEFVVEPFHNVREIDFQAALFAKLRAQFPTPVPVRFAMNPNHHQPHEWTQPRTLRVHCESCIGQKGIVGKSVNVDVIVLRDQEVLLPCHAHGPTALQETVQLDDVEAAIELKNAPSMNKAEALKFVADVMKLCRFQQQRRDLRCFSLVIDQSISLPMASSKKPVVRDWLGMVNNELDRSDSEPTQPFVEVWFVDPKTLRPRSTFFTRRPVV